jgi:hypothetical protein
MANEIGEIVVKIAADISDIKGKLADVKKSTDDLKDSFEKNLHPSIKNVVEGFKQMLNPTYALSAGLVAVTGAVLASVKAASDYGEQLLKMSKQTGISVDTLGKLKYAAEQEETSLEAVSGALKLLQKNMAAVGDTTSPYERFLQIADAVKAAETPVKRAEIAFAAFGRSGYDLIPMLTLGSDGMKTLGDKAEKLGIIIDEKTAQKADRLNDSMNTTKNRLLGVAIEITASVQPALELLSTSLERDIELMQQLGRTETDGLRGRQLTIQAMEAERKTLVELTTNKMLMLGMSKAEIEENKQKLIRLDKAMAKEKQAMEEEAKNSTARVTNEKKSNADILKERDKFVDKLLKNIKGAEKDAVAEAKKKADEIARLLSSTEERYRTHEQTVSMLSNFYEASRLATITKTMSQEQQARLASDLTELASIGQQDQAKLIANQVYETAISDSKNKSVAYDQLTNQQKMDNFTSTMNYISTLSTAKNRTLAAVGKAAAVSAATVDTFAAGSKALASAPPPWNFALMAAVIAAGMANVARIVGVKMAQGGIVNPTSGGTQATIGEAGQAEAVIPLRDDRSKKLLKEAVQTDAAAPVTISVTVNGTFLEANPAKWQKLVRTVIVPEVRRFTDINPKGPFTRRRGRSS